MKNNKPTHFLILKIIGAIAICVAVFGIVLTVTSFSNFASTKFIIGGIMTSLGLVIGIPCLVIGFSPEITKMNIKTAKYIQNENKADLKDMVDTNADIASDAATAISAAVKLGLGDEAFCKECGKKIAADSKFCRHCGKEQ